MALVVREVETSLTLDTGGVLFAVPAVPGDVSRLKDVCQGMPCEVMSDARDGVNITGQRHKRS